jgi:hypothetical protein
MLNLGWTCEIRVCIRVMRHGCWALSSGLIDWSFSHWTHVTFKQVALNNDRSTRKDTPLDAGVSTHRLLRHAASQAPPPRHSWSLSTYLSSCLHVPAAQPHPSRCRTRAAPCTTERSHRPIGATVTAPAQPAASPSLPTPMPTPPPAAADPPATPPAAAPSAGARTSEVAKLKFLTVLQHALETVHS